MIDHIDYVAARVPEGNVFRIPEALGARLAAADSGELATCFRELGIVHGTAVRGHQRYWDGPLCVHLEPVPWEYYLVLKQVGADLDFLVAALWAFLGGEG